MDDLAVPQHHRSGAHRARRHPLLVALVTVVAVAVASAALLWALLRLDVLGVGDGLLEGGDAVTVQEPQPSGPVPPATGPATAPTSGPASEAAGAFAASERTSQPEAGSVDQGLPLAVLNATTTAGLATTAAEALTSTGWTVEVVGNHDGGQTPTTVLYAEDSQLGTAEALADEVGTDRVDRSDDVDVLTVVLGPDYPG